MLVRSLVFWLKWIVRFGSLQLLFGGHISVSLVVLLCTNEGLLWFSAWYVCDIVTIAFSEVSFLLRFSPVDSINGHAITNELWHGRWHYFKTLQFIFGLEWIG